MCNFTPTFLLFLKLKNNQLMTLIFVQFEISKEEEERNKEFFSLRTNNRQSRGKEESKKEREKNHSLFIKLNNHCGVLYLFLQ